MNNPEYTRLIMLHEVKTLQLAQAEMRIAELEAENQKLKEANRWIPVSERLPTKTGQYWTTKQYEGVEVMVGQDLFISEYNEFSTQAKVIAWREIQEFWNEPYEGGK